MLVLATLPSFCLTPNRELPAPSSGPQYPPTVPPPKLFSLPLPASRALSNGLKVVVVERHSLPLVTLQLVVKAGAESDPPELSGTAQFVASLLDQGTRRRSAQQIAEAIDSVGGTIEVGADWDNSFAVATVLTDHTELAFDLLADITIYPAFFPSEVERTRKQTLSALEVLRGDPGYLADTVFNRLIFERTTYGHPAEGTLDTVRRLTALDLKQFHARYYSPANSYLTVVGDIKVEDAMDYAQKFFGAWEGSPQAPHAETFQRVGLVRSRQVVVVDKPDAVQTEIRVGNAGAGRESPDYYALTVANQILGGPASNRLFSALRSQRGLTYGASSDLFCYRNLGSWEAKTSTRTPQTIKTVRIILQQMKRLRDHPLSSQELETAQSYLIGHRALEFETSDGIAAQSLDLLTHNLPFDEWNLFPEKVQRLTREDVWSAVQRYLEPDHAVIVLVGDAEGFRKDLKKLGHAHIIPLHSVDLASANLERQHGAQSRR